MTNDATQAAMITINEADWVAERTNAGERSAVQARIAALEASLAEIKAMLTLLTGAPSVAAASIAAPAPPADATTSTMTRGQKGWLTRQQRKAGAATPATRERQSSREQRVSDTTREQRVSDTTREQRVLRTTPAA